MSKLLKAQAIWLEGTQIDSEIRSLKIRIDKPLEENGTNSGPKPAELSLQALGGCLLFAYLFAADKLRVDIDGLKVEIEGEVIAGGWEDEKGNKRAGFKHIQFRVQVNTKHSDEDIQKVHNLALQVSPMYDNFTHPVKVTGSFVLQ